MRNFLVALVILSSQAFAGGSSGTGTPPSIKDLDTLELMSFSINQLPKAYADENEFRRAAGRLSVAGIETATMMVEGDSIQVRKLRDSIVDDKVSREILPQ